MTARNSLLFQKIVRGFVFSLAVVLVFASYPQQTFAQSDQRVAYNFNENTGTTINDSSANNADATATSPSWTSSGQYGNAIVFNGASTRVRSDASISLNGAFTFSAWINNPSDQTYETIMTVGSNRAFFIDNGVLGFFDGTNEFFFGAALATNTWHYVTFVSDGTNIRAYVNAVQRGSTESMSYGSTSGVLQVGAYISGGGSNVDYFSGTIDEVRVHNYALTTTQIGQDRDNAVVSDTTAPSLSNGQPSGTLGYGTTQTNLQVTTNEAATCRYSTTASTAYASMTNTFSTTGSTSHSTNVSSLSNGTSYNYYVRCQDSSGNATSSDFTITFSVASAPLGSWNTTSALPQARSVNGATYGEGYMYLVGGLNASGSASTTVYYAEVNSDGTLDVWNTTTSFPVAVRSVRPVYYNGYVYVAGGTPDGGTLYDEVYYAEVNSDGTLGTWTETTNMPVAQISHSTVAYNGYMYIIGGNIGPTCTNTVRYAPINSNGTLGSWSSTTTLPVDARCGIVEAATVYNGRMYLVGGFNNENITSTVFYATINGNGTLGSWTSSGNTISMSREYLGLEAYNGYLFVIAGQAGVSDNVTTSVEIAQISANGSVGSFSSGPSLPAARGYLATELVNGYVYAIGGGTDISGGTPQTTAYYAQANIAAPDLTAPTVSVTAPTNGSTVSGTIAVSANASDNVGVVGVQFRLDGADLGAEDTSSPYSINWNTTSASNGAHTLTAIARDAATNETTATSINVTVNNAGARIAYNFNENTGTAINDSSANNTDATATSPTWTSSGQYSNAVTFNGSSSRVTSDSTIALTGAFTIEAWIFNPSNQTYETIASIGENRNLYLENGVVTFYTGAASFDFGSALSTNAWHHVSLVSDGSTVRVYVDGSQRGSTETASIGNTTDTLRIGSWVYSGSPVDFFSGTIDEVRVYNRALTSGEISTDASTPI